MVIEGAKQRFEVLVNRLKMGVICFFCFVFLMYGLHPFREDNVEGSFEIVEMTLKRPMTGHGTGSECIV
jgi:hypothetical protein